MDTSQHNSCNQRIPYAMVLAGYIELSNIATATVIQFIWIVDKCTHPNLVTPNFSVSIDPDQSPGYLHLRLGSHLKSIASYLNLGSHNGDHDACSGAIVALKIDLCNISYSPKIDEVYR